MSKATKNPLSKLTELHDKKDKKSTWPRTTLEIRESYKEKLDRIVYWNNSTLKDVLDNILGEFLSEKEPPAIPRADKKQPLKFFDIKPIKEK